MDHLPIFKYLGIVFIVFGVLPVLPAQPFNKAPIASKKKVRQIIEWVRPDLKQNAEEGMCSEFDRKGNLLSYYDRREKPLKKTTFKYDKRGRLLEKTEKHDEYEWKAIYSYQRDRTVEEVKFRGKTTKTFFFKNKKGQLIEKKTFTKGLELGNAFLLKEQVFYNYSKRDSLKSEKILKFNLIPGRQSKEYESRNVLHKYHPKTGLRAKTVEYDFDGSVLREVYFEYDPKKRLSKKLIHYKMEDIVHIDTHKYKNNKLWQSIAERPGYKDVNVYVDGRLIRLRSYNEDKLIRVVDYQYVYY